MTKIIAKAWAGTNQATLRTPLSGRSLCTWQNKLLDGLIPYTIKTLIIEGNIPASCHFANPAGWGQQTTFVTLQRPLDFPILWKNTRHSLPLCYYLSRQLSLRSHWLQKTEGSCGLFSNNPPKFAAAIQLWTENVTLSIEMQYPRSNPRKNRNIRRESLSLQKSKNSRRKRRCSVTKSYTPKSVPETY